MTKKRIGILTQPLHDNYGGLLQAFALKKVLESLDNNVEIINRRKPYGSLKYRIAGLVNKLKGRNNPYKLSDNEKQIISRNTKYFAEKYITDITEPILTTRELKQIESNYDGFVVGSDQVWKPSYSPNITNFFLDFVSRNEAVAVAYAASFGGDIWDYTEKQTTVCKQNVHKFKAISVREDSGVELCRNHLKVDAIHVLDPTLLLRRKDYSDLISNESETPFGENILMHYVLDITPDKSKVIHSVAEVLNLTPETVTKKKEATKENVKKNIDDCVYPSVTSWLNGFKSAKFVITDSFHGTVFSILFNKPFIVIANPRRGNARFVSLLKLFGLEDRLMLDSERFSIDQWRNMKEIQWDTVNQLIESKRAESISFLKSNLVT